MRYTIKDLFVATALIAVGVGGFCALVRDAEGRPPLEFGIWIAVCGAGALTGACLFFPFGRVWQGALWGLPWSTFH